MPKQRKQKQNQLVTFSGPLRVGETRRTLTQRKARAPRPAQIVVRERPSRPRRQPNPMDELFTPAVKYGRQAFFKTHGTNNIVRHREMIANINFGTGTPTVYNVPVVSNLNPGLPLGVADADHSVYSWIPPMANLYEKYRIKRAQIVFEPTCSLSTGGGSVAMCIDYDVRDAAPASMAAVFNNASSVYGPPWSRLVLPINPQKIPLFTRAAALSGTYDAKTYDYGLLYVATEGCPTDSANAGRLFIEYEIELSLPQ